ncbi:MAG: hypothetical protein HDT09_04795 [Bacteroidales bacterium]|nr:hypothetical protein [Bacteroidales bacterium]
MTLLSDFLTALGVPHTQWYSDRQFRSMTFKSLFGLSKLLESYGIPNEALKLSDKVADLNRLEAPFLAHTPDSFKIVESITPEQVTVRSYDGTVITESREDFIKSWDGIVLLAYPEADASEPDFRAHRLAEIVGGMRKWVLWALSLFVFAYLFISNGLWHNGWLTALTGITLVGIFVTYQLELKTLGIHTATADNICGVIDRGGCNSVLATPAAKFLGIFSWSEVGLSYFSVTLLTLLVAPEAAGWLALINACCCPYSFWSVWYQRFRAHKWCTLCLITQACLWLSLACYILAGAFKMAFPLKWDALLLVAVYGIVFLSLNLLNRFITRNSDEEN